MTEVPTIWLGYPRRDGRKGIRNLTLVVYTVECSRFVAEKVAANEPDTQVIGFHGCYDNPYAVRMLLSLATHPNVGAVLCIGLGCEYTQAEKIADNVRKSGRLAHHFLVQDLGGTRSSILHGKEWLAATREALLQIPRCEMSLADLVVGAECGGSDSTSGLAGNPVVGRCFDQLVDAGGTAIFEELVEMIGLKELMVSRGVHEQAREQLAAGYDKAEAYCRAVRQYSASPGNFAGGLTTIEEKSLGAFAKSGSQPIQGVIPSSTRLPHPGLWLLDTVPDEHFMQFGYTNPNDSEGITALVSCGCHVVLFITGRGSVIGSPIAPLIKVTGNADTYRRMSEDMDFDASGPLHGRGSLDGEGRRLVELLCRVAAGEPSKPEAFGHHEYLIPYKHQHASSRKDDGDPKC
ncbi:MAG: UxaA family hydrolase [Verrucomicrobia bacterium]|nr:UxaA family hydrolase [Verrucomicrobiota bacterium]MCH8511176.1 UxaA family hydrolase [Kiritimatiellia bacterium]